MIRKNYLLYGLMWYVSGVSMAGESQIKSFAPTHGVYATFSAGVDFIRTNEGQGLVLLVPFQDYFTGNRSYKTSGSVGFGMGIERELRSGLVWQSGLAGYYNSVVRASGHRWTFGLPDFDNFIYDYHVQSSRIVATGKLLSTWSQTYHPYLSGELGVAMNRSYQYSETALLEEALPMAPFASHSSSHFSWGVGVGVDMDLHSRLRLGIGYQFVDLGKTSLGLAPEQETYNTLHINHLYDNQVRIQLTTLF